MRKYLPFLAIILLILANDWGAIVLYQKLSAKERASNAITIADLQKQIDEQQRNGFVANTDLRQQLSSLQGELTSVNNQATSGSSVQKAVTNAVAKTTPSVVSVTISENIPQYKVVYKNPFGDDPRFRDANILVPVYEPTGQTQTKKIGTASGFIITSDGYIMTNKHVVANEKANYTVLLSNGDQQTGEVVYRDPTNDIAILKIGGGKYTPVKFGNSKNLQLGQTVIAIGNALGQYDNSVSLGIISGLNRTIEATSQNGSTETLRGVIQTDTAINLGNSGGPLIDLNGNTIGINVATVIGSNDISFSIPESTFRSIIKTAIGR